MALQVTLIRTPENLSESGTTPTVHTFDQQGGTLGRSSSNTWSLPDPDRFLSSCHCEIVADGDQFYIVDLSTNGTFVNGSPEPLGKGVKAPLTDGDTFEIGDYQFSVSLAGAATASPFGPGDDIGGPGFADFPQGSGNSPFADPFTPTTDDLSLSPDVENTDPLRALDIAGRADLPDGKDQDIFGGGGAATVSDPFAGPDPYAGMGQVDPSPGLDQAVSWPDSNRQALIPDDWEDDLLGPSTDAAPAATPIPEFEQQPPVSPPEPVAVAPSQREVSGDLHPGGAPQGVAPPNPQISPVPPAPAPEPVQSAERTYEQPVVAPAPGRGRPGVPEGDPTPQESVPSGNTSARSSAGPADQGFVAALGLDATGLTNEQINEINETAGRLVREIVEGMMQVLRSRTSIKNEFRMNVTTIEPFENNPLKFSVGVDEALENMFLKKSKAYKEPVEAFRESFQEIGEHQLAMIAGIRVGFEKMMARFDPNILQELFNRQGKSGALPMVQKGRYWSRYCEYFEGFSDNLESSFQNLFGSDFVQAYEDQLRKLSASRKNSRQE
ncbi:type VI secretion system-associated FHA domain protein TagH [Gilvimarinus sp. F26214L]|uniref:type VI secretion system-associated FHA domain protein TagH n=1 Tax=Gilvimarinus sp. DZF01 TaxID=3461371 RepID=UPI0040467AEB